MNNGEDFETLYTEKLVPHLEKLTANYILSRNWKITCVLTAIGAFLVLFMGEEMNLIDNYGIILFFLFAFLVFSIYKYAATKDLYAGYYKNNIIKEIITHISPNINYLPTEYINPEEYNSSSLYLRYYDDYSGDDFMEGTVDDMSFECSELLTTFWGTDRFARDPDRGSSRRTSIIFKGLFLSIKINDFFTGGTYVWTRGFEQVPTSIYDEHERLMPMPEISYVDFADPDFENYFSVYTTYLSQATMILTPEVRKKLISIRQRLDCRIVFSFVASRCYIAIPYIDDLLEPPILKKDFKDSVKYDYDTILLIVGMLKEIRSFGIN